jgi:predicted nucleic acid-binding Zn ribbon protein
MDRVLTSGVPDEFKRCGCGMDACCGECLRKERRRHLGVLWLATVLVILFVTALSLAVGTSL